MSLYFLYFVSHFQEAKALDELADGQFKRDRFEEAARSLGRALDLLGYRPRSDTLDDSGMKLSLADNRAKVGDWKAAASIRKSILEDHLKDSETCRSSKNTGEKYGDTIHISVHFIGVE
ncbi:MAG: hypothetical protein HY243_06560 [Proteobacteria bacterium]|nr:hypothetical protein [Pseudomonadota bacterium]